jgi:hypothetical protein
MTRWLKTLPLIALVSCATGERKNYYQITGEVSALIEARQFQTARDLIRGRGALCKGYNPNGFCYAGEVPDAEVELSTLINQATLCDSTLVGIRTKPPATREAAKDTEEKLDAILADLVSRNAYPHRWETDIKGAKLKLQAIQRSGSFAEQHPDGSVDPIAVAKNRCEAGMRWGYKSQDAQPDLNHIAIDDRKTRSTRTASLDAPGSANVSRLKGDFETSDKCEEARLTDTKAVPDGALLNRCGARYVGTTIQVKVAKVDVMLGDTGEFATKAVVFFSSLQKCRNAQKIGYESHVTEPDSDALKKIGPARSDTRPRFISDCAETQEVVCSPGSTELRVISLLE